MEERRMLGPVIAGALILIAMSMPPALAQLEGPGSGLVGWWKFDEGSGTAVYDSSGRGHNGTLVNSPTWTTGRTGGALSFDGVSTYVRIPTSPDFDSPSEFSVSAWVYPIDPTTRQTAVSRAMNNDWHLWQMEQINQPGGTARFDIEYVTRLNTSDTALRSRGSTYSMNTWHHVVAVKTTGGIVKIYVDGAKGTDSAVNPNPDPDLSGLAISIGSRRAIVADTVWNGSIDDVRFYNRSLSADEIITLFNGTAPSTYTLTVSHTGTGSGTITSSPAGISCASGTCSASFSSGIPVTLSASPASTFSGWSGSGCSGTGTCTVTMGSAVSVAANFTLNPVGDTTPPMVTAFAIPSTSSSLTVPVTTFAASDNVGVTGYLLTETSSAPSPSAPGWTITAPGSYTFASEGTKTLYAWAKDAAGLVSSSLSDSVAIAYSPPAGGIHYIRAGAGGRNDGSDWANAWNELNQVQWNSVNPGDTVLIGQGVYSTRLTMSKSGTGSDPPQRISVQKATEAGYDGRVTIPGITVTAQNATLDGIDRTMFTIFSPTGPTLIDINISPVNTTNFFELKNVFVNGTPSWTTYIGRMLNIRSGSLYINNSEFKHIHGGEDQLIMTSLGNGESLIIENSVFTHWMSLNLTAGWTHSDMFQDYCASSDCYRGDLIFRYNLVDDSGIITDMEGYENDVFMNAYTHYNNVVVEYNVFKTTHDVVKIKSARSVRITNNVFYNDSHDFGCYTNCSQAAPTVIANNIYIESRGSNPLRSNCIFSPGTSGFTAGNGNMQANPLIINKDSIFGIDNIPFTSDDGFNILAGSPAIDAGSNLGQTRDIMSNVMQGSAWDIGAYEYPAGVVCAHAADNSPCDGCVSGAELTTFIGRWYASSTGVTLSKLIEAIGYWKRGGC